MKKLIFYKRKSTDTEDKQQLSLEGQTEEVKRYLGLRDSNLNGEQYQIAKTIEESMSAKRTGRPGFNEMVDLLNARVYDGVIAYKMDRLTRNFTDLGTLSDLVQYGGKAIILTDSGLIKNNATDLFTLGINVCVAKKKVDDLSEDTKRGMKQKAALGWFPGYAPTGYLNTQNKARMNIIIIDSERGPCVEKAFKFYATGLYSLASLSDLLNKEGFKTRDDTSLSKTSLESILKNPFYYGYFRNNGGLVKGLHEPLVTKELWDQVQAMLEGRSVCTLKPRSLVYEYRGVLRCAECGCLVTAQKTKGIVYYRCSKSRGRCNQPYIQEKDLKPQLEAIFEQLYIPQERIDSLKVQLRNLYDEEVRCSVDSESNIKRQLTDLKTQKKQLFEKIISGKINSDDPMLKEFEVELGKKIMDAENELLKMATGAKNWLEESSNLLKLCQQAKRIFEAATHDEKQQLLKFVSSNLVLDRKKVLVDYKKPFASIVEAAKSTNWLRRSDSNRQPCRYTYPQIPLRGGLYLPPKRRPRYLVSTAPHALREGSHGITRLVLARLGLHRYPEEFQPKLL
ncbi:MAG: recombinase family protein [Candidatus Gracilibacteria bacterium]